MRGQAARRYATIVVGVTEIGNLAARPSRICNQIGSEEIYTLGLAWVREPLKGDGR